jgi:subtilisin family serine protease
MVTAAGNSNQPQYNPDHPNYDNRISNNNTNTFYQDTFSEFGYNVTGSTNRRGFPQHIGKTVSETSYGNTTVKFPAINVGCLDDDMTNSYDQDRKVNYSDCGNAIDFFAPGDGTLAACPDASYGVDTSRSDGEYADLTAISACRDTRFSGTSAACPVGAGLMAVVMQFNRSWTYENLRNWIETTVDEQPSSDMYEGTEVTTAGGSWSSDYNALQGADRRVLYAATIPINTPYPADFKMEGPLAITAGHFDKVV